MKKTIIEVKSFDFAVRVVKLYKYVYKGKEIKI